MFRLLTFLLLLIPAVLSAQADYWANLVYFSGCPVNHIPKGITIPDKDNTSRAILNAIIGGVTYAQLKKKFPDSLDVKLDKLAEKNVIARNGERFSLLIPVLTGEKRELLRKMIRERLAASNRSIDSLVKPLQSAFADNPEMIFHILWSRVMDDCWWDLYNATFQTDKGPPSIAMLVYPPHPWQCGTNSDYTKENDMFALSWSYNIFDEFFSVPSTRSFFDLAQKKPVDGKDLAFFKKYGLADEQGRSLIFTYRVNDATDRLCDSLKKIYIRQVKGLFDYNALGKKFGYAPDDFFIVTSHEIAYELIGMLAEKNRIYIPITLKSNPERSFRYLVSIRYFTPSPSGEGAGGVR
jgi:hypothetical protein